MLRTSGFRVGADGVVVQSKILTVALELEVRTEYVAEAGLTTISRFRAKDNLRVIRSRKPILAA